MKPKEKEEDGCETKSDERGNAASRRNQTNHQILIKKNNGGGLSDKSAMHAGLMENAAVYGKGKELGKRTGPEFTKTRGKNTRRRQKV